MTPKLITYSVHAVGQLRRRGITRPQVRWLLAHGIHSMEPTFAGDQRFGRRGYVRGRHGRHECKVIYIEDARRVHVITVEFTDDWRR